MGKKYGMYLLAAMAWVLAATSGADAEFRLSVSVSSAIIRSGPGTDYRMLWKVEKYHPLKIIKKSGDWYQFSDFEGDTGWIYEPLTAKTDTVITIKDKCNIRSGPGTNQAIAFQSGRAVVFKVIERKGKWILIRHEDGDEGWIHASLVW